MNDATSPILYLTKAEGTFSAFPQNVMTSKEKILSLSVSFRPINLILLEGHLNV
jgi:hypothetical protein